MKRVVKAMGYGLIFVLIAGVLLFMAVVRFAPSDPDLWNSAIATGAIAGPGPCVEQIVAQKNGARAGCLVLGDPAAVLARLAVIAEGWPRTTRLAGTAADGRITWISRTRIMGFPDYITAQVTAVAGGSRLEIFARQRFGDGDWGVNAARLTAWLSALDQGG